jgi:hypothetical protein
MSLLLKKAKIKEQEDFNLMIQYSRAIEHKVKDSAQAKPNNTSP